MLADTEGASDSGRATSEWKNTGIGSGDGTASRLAFAEGTSSRRLAVDGKFAICRDDPTAWLAVGEGTSSGRGTCATIDTLALGRGTPILKESEHQ